MWKKGREIVNHLLLHCEVASTLWEDIFRWIELAWVMPATMVEFLAYWVNLWGIPQISAMWKMITICITWCIWQ